MHSSTVYFEGGEQVFVKIRRCRSQPGETHTNVNNFGRIDARAHNCVNGSDFVNLMAGHIQTGLGSQTDILTMGEMRTMLGLLEGAQNKTRHR
jgi:hypothetical protein